MGVETQLFRENKGRGEQGKKCRTSEKRMIDHRNQWQQKIHRNQGGGPGTVEASFKCKTLRSLGKWRERKHHDRLAMGTKGRELQRDVDKFAQSGRGLRD